MSPDTEGASIVSVEPRSPSPKEEEPWVMFTRHRTCSDAQYENTEVPFFTVLCLCIGLADLIILNVGRLMSCCIC